MAIIYRTTCKVNGKIYIGQSKHNDPNYLGSGVLIKLAIKKYGKNSFYKEILFQGDVQQKEIDNLEIKFINEHKSNDLTKGYNIEKGGFGVCAKQSIEERLLKNDNGLNRYQLSSKKMVETRKLKDNYKTAKIKEYETKKNSENYDIVKKKISNTLTGSLWVNKNGVAKYIKNDELNYYTNDGWKHGRKNYSYQECHEFAVNSNIKSAKEWKKISKINNIPCNPNRIFEKEWTSWEEFLGKIKIKKNTSYIECSNFAKENNIKSAKEWHKLSKINNMPFHPNRKFKNEWINWNEFLQK